VDVSVGGIPVKGVIDSAAQVTVLSTRVFNKLPKSTPITGKVRLQGVESTTGILAQVAPQITLGIGQEELQWETYVAEIDDDILIGLDLLTAIECKVDFGAATITMPSGVIQGTLQKATAVPAIRVLPKKRTTLHPNSVRKLAVKLLDVDGPIKESRELLVESEQRPDIFICNTVINTGGATYLQIVNLTDRYIKIKPNETIATAMDVVQVISPTQEIDQTELRKPELLDHKQAKHSLNTSAEAEVTPVIRTVQDPVILEESVRGGNLFPRQTTKDSRASSGVV
jgi:hypothetical protein